MEKKEKKGFWASLFSSKSKPCDSEPVYTIPSGSVETHEKSVSDAASVKEIKVLGPGCARCKRTFAVVSKVVKESGLAINVTKVEDIEQIMRYNIMATPAIVVDERVVMKGQIPTKDDVRRLLEL